VALLAIVVVVLGVASCNQDANKNATAYVSRIAVQNIRVSELPFVGLTLFGEMKNTGSKPVKQIEFTIFCLADDGKPIYEKRDVAYFGVADNEGPLKPGYIRKFTSSLEHAPSEWNEKVEITITDVKFE